MEGRRGKGGGGLEGDSVEQFAFLSIQMKRDLLLSFFNKS